MNNENRTFNVADLELGRVFTTAGIQAEYLEAHDTPQGTLYQFRVESTTFWTDATGAPLVAGRYPQLYTVADLVPFDLNRALAGVPVRTRDGRKVGELHLFRTLASSRHMCAACVYAVVDRRVLAYTQDGRYWFQPDGDHDLDLFMVY